MYGLLGEKITGPIVMDHVRHAKDGEELVETMSDSFTFHIGAGESKGEP